MSIRAIQAVWDRSRAGGSTRLLLLALADFADEEGRSWPSVATLAQRVGRSERRTQQLISAAIATGELIADRTGGRDQTSRYMLTPGGQPVGKGETLYRKGEAGYAKGRSGLHPNHHEPSENQGRVKQIAPFRPPRSGSHQGQHPDCLVCAPLQNQPERRRSSI